MTFQQLLYFQSVADSLSFSKAAKECFVSQTAISRQIRQLEQEMDLRLFDRDTTHVTLTSAGRYFFQQAQQITAQLRQAVETAQQIDRASACQLVLAAPTVFEQWAAAPLLHGLRQRHPEASLSVVQGARTSLINDLVEANLDVLLALDFDMPSLDGLRVDVLSTHHAVWLLPAGHPLAGQAAIAPQQLRSESFIMTRESPTAPTIDRIGALPASARAGKCGAPTGRQPVQRLPHGSGRTWRHDRSLRHGGSFPLRAALRPYRRAGMGNESSSPHLASAQDSFSAGTSGQCHPDIIIQGLLQNDAAAPFLSAQTRSVPYPYPLFSKNAISHLTYRIHRAILML